MRAVNLTSVVQSFEHNGLDDLLRTTNEPLFEDWSLHGLIWTEGIFPTQWSSMVSVDAIEYDELMVEFASSTNVQEEWRMRDQRESVTKIRKERILWLGRKLALCGKWITYHEETQTFTVSPEYEKMYLEIGTDKDTENDKKNPCLQMDEPFAHF